MAQVTRLGLSGGPTRRYVSPFVAKTAAGPGSSVAVQAMYHYRRRRA